MPVFRKPRVKRREPILVLPFVLIAATALAAHCFADQDAGRKEILILYGLQSHMPVVLDWDRNIRAAIDTAVKGPVRIETEFLDLLRSQDVEYREQWISLLRQKFQDNRPDLIIAVFDPAMQFVLDYRDALFPGVPVVFCSAHFYQNNRTQLPPDFTGVAYDVSYIKTLELAKQMLPNLRQVAVVAGSSDYANAMLAEARGVLEAQSELQVSYLTGLSVEETMNQAAQLSDDTVILFLVYVLDPQGRHYYARNVVSELSINAAVPVFTVWETSVGSGAVGGHVIRVEQQGRMAGEIASRILNGEDPGSIPITGHDSNELVVDWRELQRWGISESRVPEDATIIHRKESLWQAYRAYLLTAAGVILLQSALILGLVVNRVRRKRAERFLTESREEARNLAGRLINAQEDERKRLAREMHDDLSQRLAAKAIDAGRLAAELDEPGSARAAAVNIRDELIRLADDVHRISRQLHPSILDDLGLADAIRSECATIADHESIHVNFDAGEVPRAIPKDIALCVYRVAQEALRNAARHSGTDRIDLSINVDDEFLYLNVQDNGKGFQPTDAQKKPGLGLASINERVRLVQGKLAVRSQTGGGTTIAIQVPYNQS